MTASFVPPRLAEAFVIEATLIPSLRRQGLVKIKMC
jgi:hypothetical protein